MRSAMARAPIAKQLADAAGLKSTNDVISALRVAVSGDRKKMRALVDKAKGGITSKARAKVKAGLSRSVERLRDNNDKARAAKRRVQQKAKASRLSVPKPVPVPASLRTTTLRRPDGRGVRLKRPATRAELGSLARVTEANNRRAFKAIANNTRSLEAVAKTQRQIVATQNELAKLLAQMQSRGDTEVMEMVMGYLARLNLRIGRCEKKLGANKKSVGNELSKLRGELTNVGRSVQIGKVSEAIGLAQSGAYGRNGSVTDRSNVTLGVTHLVTSSLGDIAKGVGIADRGPWEWISGPVGIAVGELCQRGAQRERFITGVADNFVSGGALGTERAEAVISLESRIGSDLWPSFRDRTDVVVSTTPISVPDFVVLTAAVTDGVLRITMEVEDFTSAVIPDFSGARVAWMVDTQAP